MKRQKTLSPYIVTWVEIKAQKGVVIKADQDKILGKCHYQKRVKAVYKYFVNKEKALEWLQSADNMQLKKHYDCRLLTDAQFAKIVIDYKKGEWHIPFTTKQREHVYTI